MNKLIILIPCLLFLAACSRSFDGGYNLPLLYKIDIQQGNVIEQEMLNKLKPGMKKDQVRFIMGTPVIIDPFHNNRWEYVYSFQEGGCIREQRHITLHFDKDELSHITGDVKVSTELQQDTGIIIQEEGDGVIVPQREIEEKGFFGKLWDTITPGD